MPTSAKEGKDVIVNWCKKLSNINTVLDIGVGKGTYSKVLKKNGLFTNSKWIGVEAWTPYIEEFNLTKKYNQVINEDARLVNYNSLGPVDITIMGDVLEHMTKEESIVLVNTISKISKYGIISIPIIHYPQDEIRNNPFERHIKDDWSHKEVLETFNNIKLSWAGGVVGCYLLDFTQTS